MNKRLIGKSTFLLVLMFIIVACNHEFDELERFRNPNNLSSYDPEIYPNSDIGYYRIDPKTILAELDRGETNVFTPLLEDPNLVEEPTHATASWTQEDFVEIASALGKLTWDDPMNLAEWSVYSILFHGNCQDDLRGFHSVDITLFKTVEVNGEKAYTTRLIEINSESGWVRWGSGATYSRPILHRWSGIDLAGAKITADEALHIAEENGGKEARLQSANRCFIHVGSSMDDNANWHLDYFLAPGVLSYSIDLNTGEYEVVNADQ